MGKVHTVSEATGLVKDVLLLQPALQKIQIQGEISNFRRYDSGHCYFTLKDEKSTLKAVMFRSRAALLRFKPENGVSVLTSGRIEVYERDGIYQLYVDNMFPAGVGSLMLAYEELKAKLQEEGLFSPEKKRELPFFPKSIGIITSSSGAALHDMLTVSRKRNPAVKIYFLPVRVQGKEAPEEIAAAIGVMNKLALTDVLIVGRGGGSLEELWSFNDERVVRAVAHSVIPIVSAVGHETDFTLTDFAADLRAATPSQAAELCVPDREALRATVATLRKRLEHMLYSRVEKLAIRLKYCLNVRVFRTPDILYTRQAETLDRLDERLERAMQETNRALRERFGQLAGKLDALSPLAVLGRGYSATTDTKGRVLKDCSGLLVGEAIHTRLVNGEITSRIENLHRGGK